MGFESDVIMEFVVDGRKVMNPKFLAFISVNLASTVVKSLIQVRLMRGRIINYFVVRVGLRYFQLGFLLTSTALVDLDNKSLTMFQMAR